MKKILVSVIAMMTLFVSSCSDMLDVDSGREVDVPELNQASDSLFYVLGIMQAMQQAGDAYVLQNELRGDLASLTSYADVDMQQLASFDATAENKYDSAYVYYRIINNCNYYLAHRDTTIMDGTYNVARNEYAVVLSFRAWAYLQLVRNYGRVKFITKPLESLSDIENDKSEYVDINTLVSRLADEGTQALKLFSGSDLPYGTSAIGDHLIAKMCIPVDVMLGELYLEAGRYAEAADYYYKYLLKYKMVATDQRSAVEFSKLFNMALPSDYTNDVSNTWMGENFQTISTDFSLNGRISYLPMAEDKFRGVTSALPEMFGYDYYLYVEDESNSGERYLDEIQIVPSAAYNHLADSSMYYYTSRFDGQSTVKGQLKIGDQRGSARFRTSPELNDTNEYLYIYQEPQIILYRGTTVWLHLAEAFNRMGHPDLAFAILKDGITTDCLNPMTVSYLSDESRTLLTTRYPFCIGEAASIFSASATNRNFGIHRHGCGDASGTAGTTSLYQLESEAARKIAEIEKQFADDALFSPATSQEDANAELINAVEDLLCDEYAMEFAFEGTRYSDLMRLARHKNASSPASYGANFGGRWLSKKLGHKTTKNLEEESNWYLPYN